MPLDEDLKEGNDLHILSKLIDEKSINSFGVNNNASVIKKMINKIIINGKDYEEMYKIANENTSIAMSVIDNRDLEINLLKEDHEILKNDYSDLIFRLSKLEEVKKIIDTKNQFLENDNSKMVSEADGIDTRYKKRLEVEGDLTQEIKDLTNQIHNLRMLLSLPKDKINTLIEIANREENQENIGNKNIGAMVSILNKANIDKNDELSSIKRKNRELQRKVDELEKKLQGKNEIERGLKNTIKSQKEIIEYYGVNNYDRVLNNSINKPLTAVNIPLHEKLGKENMVSNIK